MFSSEKVLASKLARIVSLRINLDDLEVLFLLGKHNMRPKTYTIFSAVLTLADMGTVSYFKGKNLICH